MNNSEQRIANVTSKNELKEVEKEVRVLTDAPKFQARITKAVEAKSKTFKAKKRKSTKTAS